MKRPTRFPCLALGAALLCSSVGCGYRTNGVFRNDIQSIYVEMFESRTYRRYLEFYLTEAVKKRIEMDTPYRLVPREQADTILRGEILEEQQAAFAPDFITRLPRDIQMVMVLRLQWQDVRTGEILYDRPVELSAVDYLPPVGETEDYAQTRALNKLADKIVTGLYDDKW